MLFEFRVFIIQEKRTCDSSKKDCGAAVPQLALIGVVNERGRGSRGKKNATTTTIATTAAAAADSSSSKQKKKRGEFLWVSISRSGG